MLVTLSQPTTVRHTTPVTALIDNLAYLDCQYFVFVAEMLRYIGNAAPVDNDGFYTCKTKNNHAYLPFHPLLFSLSQHQSVHSSLMTLLFLKPSCTLQLQFPGWQHGAS